MRVVTNFGSQYFDVCQLNGSLAVKDKSPLTVPCWFAFQTQMQLCTKSPIESAAPPPSRVAQAEGRSDSQEVVGRFRAYVMRLGLKHLCCTQKVDFVVMNGSTSKRFFALWGEWKDESPLVWMLTLLLSPILTLGSR